MSDRQSRTINESVSTHTTRGGASCQEPRRTVDNRKTSYFRKVTVFSPAVVERALGLPAGAWQSRRLFALRVRTDDFAASDIPRGSFLVIEPGAAAVPQRLIVVRTEETLELRRVARERRGAIETTDPHGLPFPTLIPRGRIVGTVIGTLAAATGKRALKRGDDEVLHGAAARQAATMASQIAPQLRAANADALGVNLDRWAVWSSGIRNPGLARAAERLGGRLRVLASCLKVASEAHLYEALVSEINKVLQAMRHTGGAAKREMPALKSLTAADRTPGGRAAGTHSGGTAAAHSARAA